MAPQDYQPSRARPTRPRAADDNAATAPPGTITPGALAYMAHLTHRGALTAAERATLDHLFATITAAGLVVTVPVAESLLAALRRAQSATAHAARTREPRP